jgi:hypothetical protein
VRARFAKRCGRDFRRRQSIDAASIAHFLQYLSVTCSPRHEFFICVSGPFHVGSERSPGVRFGLGNTGIFFATVGRGNFAKLAG